MEEPRVRPKRRTRHPEADEEAVIDTDVETCDLVKEVKQLDTKISEQEQEIDTKWACIAESKTATKDKIVELFKELKELLETKESETLEQLETYFNKLRSPLLEPSVVNVALDKSRVYTMLKNDAEYIRTFDRDNIAKSLSDLKSGVIKRDQILSASFEPNVTLNEDLRDVFEQWKCVCENSETDINISEATATSSTGNGVVIGAESVHESEQDDSLEITEGQNNLEANESQHAHHEDTPGSTPTDHSFEGATAGVTENVQPSAPLMPISDSEIPEEEDPPPYWQAIGLSGPQEVAQASSMINVPDLNTRTYEDTAPRYHDVSVSTPDNRSPLKPCNYLEVWHSFPSKRQFDSRLVTPMSLTWNYGLLCLGDRNNRKIKFFNSSGDLFGEMLFNSEIHDVAFLERCYNESRYIVTFAKICTLCIVALKSDYSTQVVKSIALKNSKPYNCISKGPKDQTLVGGSGLPSNHLPSVDIIDFSGNVKLSFQHTPDLVPFAFPKSVQVLNQFIVISDWRLNVVCVFFSDGSPVGQYSGTPSTPLTDPSDITLDHFGNIMVLDGHLPNIHVIDLKCVLIEIIKLPQSSSDARSRNTKFLAFDSRTKMLGTVKNNGQVAIYSFRGGYESVSQGTMVAPEVERREPVVLPLIEGMLPSTIENMRSRSRPSGRTGVYHL